jgi:hypothetical protein
MRFSWLPVLAPGTAKSTGVSDSPLLFVCKARTALPYKPLFEGTAGACRASLNPASIVSTA